MTTSDRIHLRLFVEVSPSRSAEVAAALTRRLAHLGNVRTADLGRYWKIPEYTEFDIEVTPTGNVSACVAAIRALQPAGWSGDAWTSHPDGPKFLLPQVRWVWLTSDDR